MIFPLLVEKIGENNLLGKNCEYSLLCYHFLHINCSSQLINTQINLDYYFNHFNLLLKKEIKLLTRMLITAIFIYLFIFWATILNQFLILPKFSGNVVTSLSNEKNNNENKNRKKVKEIKRNFLNYNF